MKKIDQPKYIYLPILFGKTAITVYPYVFWSKGKEGWKNPCIIKHEMCHWESQKKWKETKPFGIFLWLALYIMQWIWYNLIKWLPAEEHPMEKPAYEIRHKCEETEFGDNRIKKSLR